MNFRNLLCFVTICFSCANAQQPADVIRLNQIGFYPHAEKIAIVANEAVTQFTISTPDNRKVVFQGKLSEPRKSLFSDKKTRVADFSSVKAPGTYVVSVPGIGTSHPFVISDRVHEDVSRASLKSYYYQRFSTALPQEYAGRWSRAFSHPDTMVMIHASAASKERPAGTTISCPKGWIDAGDYNKYIVNSGITMGTLMSAYEDYPEYYAKLKTNIPESNNQIPDILDEVLWNLRWMLTMQDPNDGGVYHKCTNAKFDPMVMPDKATTPRYVVQKGTAAALDFTAVTAQAARIFKKFDNVLPGLSDSCINASKKAWAWAMQHPNVEYNQNKINTEFDPDITTGGYGDKSFSDEFIWAACELTATTGSEEYITSVSIIDEKDLVVPTWNQVQLLGYYTLLRNEKQLPSAAAPKLEDIKKKLIRFADELISGAESRTYMTVMGRSAKDFEWGSNAVAANQAIVLVNTCRFSKEKNHLRYALFNLDYLLGRNATGFSFLTGYGDKTPMHIHHRPSEADGIEEPVPGLLAGGPNPGMQDKCNYSSSVPDEAYVDHVCSYASNEVAINWNAPFVYLAGAIENLYSASK
jgi:endoglucanase